MITYHVMAQYGRKSKPMEVGQFADRQRAETCVQQYLAGDPSHPRVWLEETIDCLSPFENDVGRDMRRELAQ